jgi:hypothetical protein
LSEHETALEVGWLLAELEVGYRLDELARRFDRSASWVSRRLALVEVLPETIQQQVRKGKVLAQVAFEVSGARGAPSVWKIASGPRRSSPSITAICDESANCNAAWPGGSTRDPQTIKR